jgi:hypothetical protein
MHKTFLMTGPALALALCVSNIASNIAQADVLAMPAPATDAAATATWNKPAKGSTMASVKKAYGEPVKKHPPAGGDTRKHPPITRWDYSDFSVFFEHGHVIDSVLPDAPAPLHNTDQLKK